MICYIVVNNKPQDKNLKKEIKKRNDYVINVNPNSEKIIIQEIFPYDKYLEEHIPDFKFFYYLNSFKYYYSKV